MDVRLNKKQEFIQIKQIFKNKIERINSLYLYLNNDFIINVFKN